MPADLPQRWLQQRRLFGPVVDPESMNEMLRRELLAEEEERLPRGWF